MCDGYEDCNDKSDEDSVFCRGTLIINYLDIFLVQGYGFVSWRVYAAFLNTHYIYKINNDTCIQQQKNSFFASVLMKKALD